MTTFSLTTFADVLGFQFWKSNDTIERTTVVLHQCFHEYLEVGDKLFIRNAYEAIFEKIAEVPIIRKNVIVVQGTPGVGKTFFLFYMLYKFKKNNTSVAVSIGSVYLILDHDYPRMARDVNELSNYLILHPDCIYLHDPYNSDSDPVLRKAGLTIIITSVDERNIRAVKNMPKKVIIHADMDTGGVGKVFISLLY